MKLLLKEPYLQGSFSIKMWKLAWSRQLNRDSPAAVQRETQVSGFAPCDAWDFQGFVQPCAEGISGSLLVGRRAVVTQTNFRQDGTLRLREPRAGQLRHTVGNPPGLSEALGRCVPALFGQIARRASCCGACRLANAAQSESNARSKPSQRVRPVGHVLLVFQRHHRLLGAAKITNINFDHWKFLRVAMTERGGRSAHYKCIVYTI